ncbi:unnamed protein product [Spirodela intermedia]|uniref:CASP-like protein n=1 Tax=Spirodela intermedia TaxID=51605 RepID=A0A7I8J6N5_SPIIN|nr:unnamed protein product [Spirodela intermedia]CAA6665771.1 unnamed protein product [Spirodela intermedia]
MIGTLPRPGDDDGKGRTVFLVVLRGLAMAATLSATILMAVASEKTTVFSITFEAKFQNSPALWFSVVSNAVSAGYSFLALFISPTSSLFRFVVPLDAIVAMLLTGALAAAGSISYLGKKGNPHTGWMPICGQVPGFCDQMMISIVCAFIGVLLYTAIVLYNVSIAMNSLISSFPKLPVSVPRP